MSLAAFQPPLATGDAPRPPTPGQLRRLALAVEALAEALRVRRSRSPRKRALHDSIIETLSHFQLLWPKHDLCLALHPTGFGWRDCLVAAPDDLLRPLDTLLQQGARGLIIAADATPIAMTALVDSLARPLPPGESRVTLARAKALPGVTLVLTEDPRAHIVENARGEWWLRQSARTPPAQVQHHRERPPPPPPDPTALAALHAELSVDRLIDVALAATPAHRRARLPVLEGALATAACMGQGDRAKALLDAVLQATSDPGDALRRSVARDTCLVGLAPWVDRSPDDLAPVLQALGAPATGGVLALLAKVQSPPARRMLTAHLAAHPDDAAPLIRRGLRRSKADVVCASLRAGHALDLLPARALDQAKTHRAPSVRQVAFALAGDAPPPDPEPEAGRPGRTTGIDESWHLRAAAVIQELERMLAADGAEAPTTPLMRMLGTWRLEGVAEVQLEVAGDLLFANRRLVRFSDAGYAPVRRMVARMHAQHMRTLRLGPDVLPQDLHALAALDVSGSDAPWHHGDVSVTWAGVGCPPAWTPGIQAALSLAEQLDAAMAERKQGRHPDLVPVRRAAIDVVDAVRSRGSAALDEGLRRVRTDSGRATLGATMAVDIAGFATWQGVPPPDATVLAMAGALGGIYQRPGRRAGAPMLLVQHHLGSLGPALTVLFDDIRSAERGEARRAGLWLAMVEHWHRQLGTPAKKCSQQVLFDALVAAPPAWLPPTLLAAFGAWKGLRVPSDRRRTPGAHGARATDDAG